MSTLTMQFEGLASRQPSASRQPGLFARLIKAREEQARRKAIAYLAAQSDERLQGLGYGADDISALRAGALPLPKAR